MSGPIAKAAALACLLGLAACGGGGGGGSAGGGDPMPMPMPMPMEPFHFEEDAAKVTALNAVIDAYTPSEVFNTIIAPSQLAVSNTYDVILTGDDPPGMNSQSLNNVVHGPLDRRDPPLGDNVWLFTHTYTQNSVEYKGFVVLSYDTALTGDDTHEWGVWLRQRTDTGAWSEVNVFNTRAVASQAQPGLTQQNNLEGSFAYTGSALGVYTKDAAAAGWFSADAELTVNFGGDDVADDIEFTMTGTIDNFALSGQEEPDWSVALAGAPPKDGSGTPTDNVWNMGTADGGAGQNGAFRAILYGPLSGGTPTVAVGKFVAHFSDGKAAGVVNVSR